MRFGQAFSVVWEAWLTLGVVVLLVAALATNRAGPDLVLLVGLTVLLVTGMLSGSQRLPSPEDAIGGFGSVGPITVGVLFVVVEGLVRTGAMTRVTRPLLGLPKTALSAQFRLLPPVAALSAFLNNTPIVAMFMPVVDEWCRKMRLSPSKLFIPLSYASILGGVCTLVGTSSNLVINGLILSHTDLPALGMFEVAWVGLPCAAVGLAYLMLASRRLLPDRRPPVSLQDDPRRYTVEMIVERDGPLVGRTVQQAGLRHLPGLFLVEIARGDDVLAAVGPAQRLEGGDRLVFVGIVASVVDLQRIRGLAPATDQVFKLAEPRTHRCLIEAVVSDQCPLLGKTIRESRFRTVYNAAIIAVARSGRRLEGKIGDIALRTGDTLLLEAAAGFVDRQRNGHDFFLASAVADSAPPRHERAWVALAILAGMVSSVAMGWLSMLAAALLAAGLMVLTRCCTGGEARRSVNWPVLLAIGAALGIGRAMQTSGAAGAIAGRLGSLSHGSPWVVLAAVYLVTALCTELITSNAAAVLVFPIALASAEALGVSAMPFIMAVMVAASASFATPIGSPTKLMVYGPGGYRFGDYVRIGLPLNGLILCVTVGLAPLIWPFHP